MATQLTRLPNGLNGHAEEDARRWSMRAHARRSPAWLFPQGALAAAVWASLLASGCMMEPLHGDSIEDRHEDTFDFWGATDFAFETIWVQARDDTGVWSTIATTTSSKLPETMWGVTAYPWERLDVRVPVRGHYWVDTAEPGFHHECELRAVGSMSGPLVTFDASMRGSFTSDPDYSLLDLWNDYGHGDSVTVYSEN